MNVAALVVGIIVAFLIIYQFRKLGYKKRQWTYPALLATFPLYYWVFAIYSSDFNALLNEVFAGVFFIITAFLGYKFGNIKGLILLAVGFISHGFYDVIHLALYNNSVAPSWWPEFCGSIDILLGVYMLHLARILIVQADIT